MNSSALKHLQNLIFPVAIIIALTAVWSGGVVFAASADATAPVKAESPVVVDKQPELDLDLKIFLHRNGFVLTNGRG